MKKHDCNSSKKPRKTAFPLAIRPLIRNFARNIAHANAHAPAQNLYYMTRIKRPYTSPAVSLTAVVTRSMLMGSLDKPGGQIDPFNFGSDDDEEEP